MISDKQRANLNWKSPRRVGKRERAERAEIAKRRAAIDAERSLQDDDAARVFYANTGKGRKTGIKTDTARIVVLNAHEHMRAQGTAKRNGKTRRKRK